MQKAGCPHCNISRGWTKHEWLKKVSDKLCTLYIIRCYSKTEDFIKIGMSSNTISKRFQSKREMPYSYEIIQVFKGSANDVWDLELFYHKQLKDFKYIPTIPFKGLQECFKKEILTMIKNVNE